MIWLWHFAQLSVDQDRHLWPLTASCGAGRWQYGVLRYGGRVKPSIIERWNIYTPGRSTWEIIMEVWKISFLSKWVICRFYVNLPGCNQKQGNHHPTTTRNFGSCTFGSWNLSGGKYFMNLSDLSQHHPNFHPELFDESSCYGNAPPAVSPCPEAEAHRSILVVLVQKKGCRRPKATRHLFLWRKNVTPRKCQKKLKIRANRSICIQLCI